MRKYINVRLDTDEFGRQNVHLDVLKGPQELKFGGNGACGYLDDADEEDLELPARLMAQHLTGRQDEELIDKLVEAFGEILRHRPIDVKVNYA